MKTSLKNKFKITAVVVSCGLAGFGGSYLANQWDETVANDAKVVLNEVNTSSLDMDYEDLSDVVANIQSSVVEITTESAATGSWMGQYVTTGAGSGVILSTDGYIATNHHVIDGASTITVRLMNGETYEATLVGDDQSTDLAVLKIDASDLIPVVMGNSDEIKVAQTAIAIGNPLGELGGSVTTGIISALDREITIEGETMNLLQTDTAINPGNSGGGLFNKDGILIGIVNAKSSGSEIEGLGFAIPVNTVKEVVQQLIDQGYVGGRVSVGLTVVDIQDAQTAMNYRVSELGLYVYESTQDAILKGDRIVSFEDNVIDSYASFKSILKEYEVGDTVNLGVVREGKTLSVSITLQERKS